MSSRPSPPALLIEPAATEAQAKQLRSKPRRRPHYRALGAALTQLTEPTLPLAVVGFSMGGHWAVWLSQRDYGLRAAVLNYAARAGTFRSDVDYQAHFADGDPWVSTSARARMETALRRAGSAYTPHDYPGTAHWFAESDRVEYAKDPAELALTRDLEFLQSALGARDLGG